MKLVHPSVPPLGYFATVFRVIIPKPLSTPSKFVLIPNNRTNIPSLMN